MKKDKQIQIRIDNELSKAIKEGADRLGMKQSEYIRLKLYEREDEWIPKRTVFEWIEQMTIALNRYEDRESRLVNKISPMVKELKGLL